MKDLTFVINLEPYTHSFSDTVSKDSQKMCLMLCESIRLLGMYSPILIISANGNMPNEETISKLSGFGAKFDRTILKEKPFNGYFNKIYAYEYLSKKVSTPYVCFIDVDVLFLKPLDAAFIKASLKDNTIISALGYEPIPYIPEGLEVGPKYLRVFKNEECELYMRTTYNFTKYNSFSSGVMFFKNDANLQNIMYNWLLNAEAMSNDENIKKYYTSEIFDMNTLTDADVLSQIITKEKAIVLQIPELVHYHTFESIPHVFKDIEMSDHMRMLLTKYKIDC